MTTTTKATWRTVRKGGKTALRSPQGRYFYGTPEEVKEARLLPKSRMYLADRISWLRGMSRQGYYTREELREVVSVARREAVSMDVACLRRGVASSHIPLELSIAVEASARYMGQSVEEFVADAVDAAVRGTMDKAQIETGRFDLPYTRHERDAVARLREVAQ